MQAHKTTFGTGFKDHKRLSQGQVKERLHQAMWSLAIKLPAADNLGRTHAIRKWKIQGVDVCRKGWERAHGLGERLSRTLYSMVLRGYGPADAADGRRAAAAVRFGWKDRLSPEEGRHPTAVPRAARHHLQMMQIHHRP